MNRIQRLAQDTPRGRRVQHFADGGPVGYGAKGLAGLREMIPKVQAMGYPQAAPAPTADPRGVAGLKAMIPRVESMGYQQAGAAPPQYFAEGGLVKRLQQLVGMDPERNARIANYKAQSAAERLAGAPPPPTPAPAPAISGYNGMSAAQRREKEAGLKNGGHVRGPGTGTSDSIPARLSDGEFVLPADTVRKVGVRRLQDLVNDTHTPVKGGSKPGHFVNGGFTSSSTADDTLRQMQQQTEQRQREGQALGQAAAADAQAQAEKIAQGMSASRAAAQSSADAPAAAPAPASAASPAPSLESRVASIPTGGTRAAPTADGSQDSIANTDAGRNITNTLSAIPGLGGIGRVASTGGAVSNGINAASRLMNNTAAVGAAGVAAPSIASAASDLTAPTSTTPPAPPSPGQPQERSPVGDRINFTSPQDNQVSRSGNSYSGENVSGNFTIGGDGPRGGQISAQNMAAADNLAARQSTGAAARLAGDSGSSAPSANVPTTMHSGNSWQARNDLRNLEVSAKSITANGGPFDRNKGVSPERSAYAAAFNADLALKGGQDPVALAAMREAGSTQRANIGARRDDMANALDQRRLGLQETAAGYQNRSADRLDRAQQDLERATTPEARASARERLMGLAGKTDNEWRLQVTPTTKNADGSTTEGSAFRYNQRTGQTERVNVGQGATQPPANHVAALRSNPKQAAQFDEIYGQGAAARAMGRS